MDTTNTSTQSLGLRVRFNVSTGVQTEVTTFCSDRWIIGFEVEIEVDFGLFFLHRILK
jgi:hypothetical protein